MKHRMSTHTWRKLGGSLAVLVLVFFAFPPGIPAQGMDAAGGGPGNNAVEPRPALQTGGCSFYSYYSGIALFDLAQCGFLNDTYSTSTFGFRNLTTYNFNDMASSIYVANGWSVRVYQHIDRGGASRCVNQTLADLSGEYFTQGEPTLIMDKQISSIDVYHNSTCSTVDLTVESITFNPPAPGMDQPVTITTRVRNAGNTSTTGGYLDVYLGHQPAGCYDDQSFKYFDLGTLQPGETRDFSFIHPGFGVPDFYSFWAYVDSFCVTAEGDETNNIITSDIWIDTHYTLTVSKAGTGTVTSDPAGISCGSTCSAQFESDGMVTLSAAADGGSQFSGWSGSGCTGTGTCVVTMSATSAVTANFAPAPPPTPTNFEFEDNTSTSVFMQWDDVGGETGYKIYKWGYSGGVYDYNLLASLPANTMGYADTGLICGGFYKYKISAYNDIGESALSSELRTWTSLCSGATFYQHADFTGSALSIMSEGWHNTGSPYDDMLSSVMVAPGWSTRVFVDGNLEGASRCFAGNDPDFAGDTYDNGAGLNDSISSMIVYDEGCSAWGARPGNDDFNSAVDISGGSYSTDYLNVTGATSTWDDPAIPCASAAGAPAHQMHSVWYSWTPPVRTLIEADATNSDYDTVMAIWTGSRGALVLAACNNDYLGDETSLINFTGEAGTTYYIEITSNGIYSAGQLIPDFYKHPYPAPFNKTAPANASAGQALRPTLSWDASQYASGYQYCVDSSNNDQCDTQWVWIGTSTSVVLEGLSILRPYYWQVRASSWVGTTYSSGGWWGFSTNYPYNVYLPRVR